MIQLLFLLVLTVAKDAPAARQDLIVVVGASGAPVYGEQFLLWSERWEQAAQQGQVRFHLVGRTTETEQEDRTRLQQAIAAVDSDASEPVWLVLIGHGTYDGQSAKFNLRGPDVSATQLRAWLKPITRPTILINCTSSSGPFINQLSGANRIVVTATKSGHEHNFSRFGDHLSAAITDLAADLDKDEQVSLLEAYLAASSRVANWYRQEARLATEHALLDDNADKRGTPADWFQGVRAQRAAQEGAAVDGLRANQVHLLRSKREEGLTADARTKRDRLERQIDALRRQKTQIEEAVYYDRLEPLFLELARLYTAPAP